MKMRALSACLLLLVGMVACSQPDEAPPKDFAEDEAVRPVCGESFCLPGGTALFGRASPAEDFNVYEVEWRGKRFIVYEGNAPQRRSGSAVVEWGSQWPNYLELSCADALAGCSAKALAAKLRHKR